MKLNERLFRSKIEDFDELNQNKTHREAPSTNESYGSLLTGGLNPIILDNKQKVNPEINKDLKAFKSLYNMQNESLNEKFKEIERNVDTTNSDYDFKYLKSLNEMLETYFQIFN